ncbi:hypothetical protein FOC1_g10010442 [Fusarium oxysporum f. sp. cubense race 1]|uniref:Uncharacterized protein n=1 Tax=Fusarium oxysporum f. sp. cubense (strain race 1) TaxID=1229664 RepID=N4V1W0_FUSC1|nr:hypothetical protein FOC1_g10010442 [Fusarium oxysporum f. sp. cubense race 1]
MGHSDSKIVPEMSPHSAQRGIPHVLRASYKKGFSSKILVHLEEPDREPLYSISLPAGWYGQMLLHDGPSSDSPILAGAEPEGKWRVDYGILLPSVPEYESSGREILRRKNTMKDRYWFGMQVGRGADRHVERFEWRRSHGSEVKSVGESRYGWKLVRLGHGAEEPNDGNPNDEPDRGNGITNDGHEVVAVWAGSGDWKSMHKIGTFQLVGSGATSELGMQWKIMALMSCLCFWQKTMRDNTTIAIT